jgi:hypothetical protein
MSLIECRDCGHKISDEAGHCVNCGRPNPTAVDSPASKAGPWTAVLRSKTPINLFSLAMMACAAVFGFSATKVQGACSLVAFTYTLHVFLAVTGMFFVTLLFNRSGVYHPDDMAKAKRDGFTDFGKDRPLMAAALIGLMLFAYGLYQYSQGSQGVPMCN